MMDLQRIDEGWARQRDSLIPARKEQLIAADCEVTIPIHAHKVVIAKSRVCGQGAFLINATIRHYLVVVSKFNLF